MTGRQLKVKRRRARIGAAARLVYPATMTASPDPRSGLKSGGGRRRVVVVLAAVAAAAVIDAAMTFAFWRSGEFADDANTNPVDAAVVYFTDDDKARARRLETAIALYRESRAARLALVGGFRREGVAAGAEIMARAAIAAGVSPADVHFDSRSFDTTSNVAAGLEIARANGWTRLIHVSDGMHLARIRDAVPRRRDPADATHWFLGAPYGGPAEIWTRAHYEAATRLLELTLSKDGVRRLARRLRVEERGFE